MHGAAVTMERGTRPKLAIDRIRRPMFKVEPRGGSRSRWSRSEWQAYLFLARRVIDWIRDHYRDENNACRLCADTPRSNEDGERLGCRYHADRSFRRLADRI